MEAIVRMLVLLLVIGAIVFVIFAWAKGWLKGAGTRGSFTGQVIMHDMSARARQKAMEYVMDEQEEKEKKDASSGQDKKPGRKKKKHQRPG
ncbi:MAG: hypothetical protein JSV10_01125 [Candidatus Zixiibacteriota bacterium]|nr:MAG: hypothetical protein JSV10_01125 [candidate division Zixibacteria bacterium]